MVTARATSRRASAWEAGSTVVLRHVRGRRTWCAVPVTVLEDGPRLSVLRISAGTDWLAAVGRRGQRVHGYERHWRLAPVRWHTHDITYLCTPGRWFAIGLVTRAQEEAVLKYYVNAQDPLTRTPWGFDTMDRELDLEVDASTGRARWKDVEHFRRLSRAGAISPSTRARIWRDLHVARELVTRRLSAMPAAPVMPGEISAWQHCLDES